jgi:hypothetical protein
MDGAYNTHVEEEGVYRVLVEKPEGMRHNIIIIHYNKDNI